MSEKVGVFIDSFPVLHRGYKLCFKYALSQVQKLKTVIYENPNSNIPLQVRANWLKTLYPDMEVIEAWINLEQNGNNGQDKLKFLNGILDLGKIDEFYSISPDLEYLYSILNRTNGLNHKVRGMVQDLSARIKDDSYGNISLMDDFVYKDLITRVAFVGAQSTGKSTIAEAMAKRYNTNYMFEYGRHHWDVYQKDRIETLEQIEEITERQLAMEDERAKTANRYLFVDTCPIVTLRYAYDWHGKATDKLLDYAKFAESRYDVFFLCGDDIPYADTPERDGAEQRTSFQNQIRSELQLRRIPYIDLRGSLDRRVEKVCEVLRSHQKYTSLSQSMERVGEKRRERYR